MGTRIAEDFGISQKMRDWAAAKVPQVDIDAEHETFCDYWRAKAGAGARKEDWEATWRVWMRRAPVMKGAMKKTAARLRTADEIEAEERAHGLNPAA